MIKLLKNPTGFSRGSVNVEPDQNKRKRVSVHCNIQKPITAVDIRATDERPMLLKSHMEDVGFYLGVKRGDELPKGATVTSARVSRSSNV